MILFLPISGFAYPHTFKPTWGLSHKKNSTAHTFGWPTLARRTPFRSPATRQRSFTEKLCASLQSASSVWQRGASVLKGLVLERVVLPWCLLWVVDG